MAPPANTAFATALDLGSTLPISNLQSDINDAGVNYSVFYKFTCPAGLRMVWVNIYSDVSDYTPEAFPYDQTQTEILISSITTSPYNKPIQFPVTAGQVHYIKAQKNVDTAGPRHVNLTIHAVANETIIPANAIIINGDTIGQPCGIFSHTVDYQVIKFVKNFPIGEGGDISHTGKLLFDNQDISNKFLGLYSGNDLTLLDDDATTPAYSSIRYNRTTRRFFILTKENVGFSKLYRTPDASPIARTLVATLTGYGSAATIATNAAETIAYFHQGTAAGQPIRRWDLATNLEIATFAAAPTAAYWVTDVLVLEDDSVVVGWSSADGPTGVVKIRRYDTAGVQLNEYQFDSYEFSSWGFVRLAYASDSPLSFWCKLRERSGVNPTGNAIFKRVRISDGTALNTVLHMEYNERNFTGSAAASYSGEAGIWNSCPMVVYPASASPPPGMYKFVTNKRNDNDIAIPAPTFKTGLIP